MMMMIMIVMIMMIMIQVSVHDIEKSVLLGRVSIPLLGIKTGVKWFALKDKNLRHPTRGMEPEIELEFDLNYNIMKAALKTFTPKEEVYLKEDLVLVTDKAGVTDTVCADTVVMETNEIFL